MDCWIAEKGRWLGIRRVFRAEVRVSMGLV
jgi:hypothetical protein